MSSLREDQCSRTRFTVLAWLLFSFTTHEFIVSITSSFTSRFSPPLFSSIVFSSFLPLSHLVSSYFSLQLFISQSRYSICFIAPLALGSSYSEASTVTVFIFHLSAQMLFVSCHQPRNVFIRHFIQKLSQQPHVPVTSRFYVFAAVTLPQIHPFPSFIFSNSHTQTHLSCLSQDSSFFTLTIESSNSTFFLILKWLPHSTSHPLSCILALDEPQFFQIILSST